MYDKNEQIKNRIFSAFSPDTQNIFSNRKSQLIDDSKAFKLFLEMVNYEQIKKNQVKQQQVTVTNQAKEEPKLKYANGVIMRPGPDGKMIFEEA